jgi:hypothetical protein
VEPLAAICVYGVLNRWSDSMMTDLEDGPCGLADRVLDDRGGGKHVDDRSD